MQGAAAQVAAERVMRLDADARDRIEGRLGKLRDSSATMVWGLDVGEATGVRIDVEGKDFDPAVELCRAEGDRLVQVAENLDGPRSLNPQLDAFLAPGRWLVVVKSEALGGPFTLLVRQTDEKPLAQSEARDIRAGETAKGRIKAEPDMSVTLKDRFRLPVRAGQSFLVTARSDTFDTILRVRDPTATGQSEPLAQDDDGWDGLNSALSFTAPSDGNVIIEIGDNNGKGGAYALAVRALGSPPANPPPLADGSITLSLDDARAPVAPGLPLVYRLFTLSGTAGERVRVGATDASPVVLHALVDTPLGLRSVATSGGLARRGGQTATPALDVTFLKAGVVNVLVGTRDLPSESEKVGAVLSVARAAP